MVNSHLESRCLNFFLKTNDFFLYTKKAAPIGLPSLTVTFSKAL